MVLQSQPVTRVVSVSWIVTVFPIWHFAGNDVYRGSNQVAVALIKIPSVKMNGSGKNGMLSGGLFYTIL